MAWYVIVRNPGGRTVTQPIKGKERAEAMRQSLAANLTSADHSAGVRLELVRTASPYAEASRPMRRRRSLTRR